MTGQKSRIERLGLSVGKCTIRSDQPQLIDFHYLMDDPRGAGRSVRHRTYRCDSQEITFPGRHDLVEVDGQSGVEFDVARAGDHAFALRLQAADRCIHGYGLSYPGDTQSLMVSWWSGKVEPYGVVKYTIRDERTIEGYYISKMSPDQPGTDIAIGDTSRGFSGEFVLNSREVNGRTWGPHDWSLRQQGDTVDMVWREHGKVFCLGLGMIDPADRNSVLANYIPV